MATQKKDEGLLGTGIDARTVVNAAQMGAGLLPKVGNPLSAGLEYVSAGMDRDDYIKQSLAMMGDGTKASELTAGSPAFRQYVKDLAGLETERLSGLAVGMGGGMAALALAGAIFGLPAGLPGMLVGGGLMVGGGMAASLAKEQIWPSQDNKFLLYASQLQQMGQARQMTPEAAFVALAMNLPEEQAKKEILRSIPKSFRITRVRDLTRLLATDQGREALRAAMAENDNSLRASIGAMSMMPQATLSEQFAALVNQGQMAGVDLLNLEKTAHVGTLLAMVDAQAMQQTPQAPYMPALQPNVGLPSRAGQAQTI